MNYNLLNFCEVDKYATKSYCAVHGVDESMNLGDITKVDIEALPKDVDFITHGSPCFLAGERVNTIDGFRNIEDIEEGDIVKTHTGEYKKVIATMSHGADNIYDIKCSATHNINCTGNHPFYVLRDGKRQWINAEDLTTKDFLCIPINKKEEPIKWDGVELYYNQHTEISNKLPLEDKRFWYLIGRFIGDGWVTHRAERGGNISGIKICCAHNEIDELLKKIGNIFNYCVIKERTVYKVQIALKELGVFCSRFGEGAINKHIPQDILDMPKDYLWPLYHGLMDSDGYERDGEHKLSSISRDLVYNFGELVLKLLNHPYSISKTYRPETCIIEGRTVNQHHTYTCIWKDNYLTRINFTDEDYLYSRVRKISCREEECTVYNLEVEGDHTYCVNNVAVHNCQSFSIAGKQHGGDEGGGTRSSLMWNSVEIIKHCQPKFVLWENVKNVLSKRHRHNFDKYLSRLEELGYNNYYKVLNAKDYGIPQNRERIYCLSIRKDIDTGTFEFPKPIELELRLKDMLDDEVDEKYYLSVDRFVGGYMGNAVKPDSP